MGGKSKSSTSNTSQDNRVAATEGSIALSGDSSISIVQEVPKELIDFVGQVFDAQQTFAQGARDAIETTLKTSNDTIRDIAGGENSDLSNVLILQNIAVLSLVGFGAFLFLRKGKK